MAEKKEAFQETRAPIVLIKIGRGRLGGSTLLQALSERAIEAGRPALMGDADRNNKGLSVSPLYATYGLPRPNETNQLSMEEWLNNAFLKVEEEQKSLLLDVGGGDQLIKEYSETISLIEMGKAMGITIVGLFMCGAAEEDFDFIKRIWETTVFHPEKSVLVFNDFTVPNGLSADRVYQQMMTKDKEEFFDNRTELVTIRMPNLRYINIIKGSGLTLHEAGRGEKFRHAVYDQNSGQQRTRLDPIARFLIQRFFADLEKSISFANAGDFLP